jgi:hypothetical protein
MMFEDTGTWRDLATGVNPEWAEPDLADGATDQPGIPTDEPVHTRVEGPWGIPWWEGMEDPFAPTGLLSSPDPTYPEEDIGKASIVGAYEPAFRTHGPVQAWGHEPSGGLTGDQAIGRIMRFPANIPDRYDSNGVWNLDYRDQLAMALQWNAVPDVNDNTINTSLVQWPYQPNGGNNG